MALPICNLDYYFTWPHMYLLDVRFGLHVLVLRDVVGRRLTFILLMMVRSRVNIFLLVAGRCVWIP